MLFAPYPCFNLANNPLAGPCQEGSTANNDPAKRVEKHKWLINCEKLEYESASERKDKENSARLGLLRTEKYARVRINLGYSLADFQKTASPSIWCGCLNGCAA